LQRKPVKVPDFNQLFLFHPDLPHFLLSLFLSLSHQAKKKLIVAF